MKLYIRPIIVISIFLLTFSSCQVIGITNDYKKLSKAERSHIAPFTSFDSATSGHIYEINGKSLLKDMKKYPRSMVYIFVNGCSSAHCYPLTVYENYAEKYGYKLYLVMSGYGSLPHTLGQDIKSPLYAIDTKYYGTRFQYKYLKCFTNELGGYDKDAKVKRLRNYGPIFFFKEDDLKVAANKLPEGDLFIIN